MNGMKLLKRMLCVLLCVVILSGTVGTRCFDANHMEKVEAAAETVAVGLSVAALYAICFYVGTVAYAHAPIEMNTLTDDQIASMGYSTIAYMTANNLMGIPAAPNAPLIGFVDKAGQSYVFGSEAFKAVAETSFQVIQGGKKPDDDDDDDEEGGIIDNLIQFPGNAKSLSGVCTAAFAGILGSVVKDQYSRYMDGEESIYQAAVEQNFTGYEQNADGSYSVSGFARSVTDSANSYNTWSIENESINERICLVRDTGYSGDYYVFRSLDELNRIPQLQMQKGYHAPGVDRYWNDSGCIIDNSIGVSLSFNIPVFASQQAYEDAFSSGDYSGAINYAKEYRIADWLSEDWAGVLTDPLTGLQALGNWANIARHQGLSALGNELDLDSFKDYLRDFFANPGTSPGTDPQPAVDPSKAPVLYPSGDAEGALDPDTDIDPARDPVIFPDPSIKPKPDPDPGTDPDPKPDPDPEPAPLPDMDAADYKVELSGIFPFCIPFDFIALLRTLDAEPRAPCFTFPVVIPALSYREDVKLDLAIFDDVAKVIRLCEKVSFILFLMFVTSKVIRW